MQRRGQPIRDLGPHQSDFTAANVPHWHGAVPDSHVIQASLSFGGIGPWLEPVTDEEYLGKSLPSSHPTMRNASSAVTSSLYPSAAISTT